MMMLAQLHFLFDESSMYKFQSRLTDATSVEVLALTERVVQSESGVILEMKLAAACPLIEFLDL